MGQEQSTHYHDRAAAGGVIIVAAAVAAAAAAKEAGGEAVEGPLIARVKTASNGAYLNALKMGSSQEAAKAAAKAVHAEIIGPKVRIPTLESMQRRTRRLREIAAETGKENAQQLLERLADLNRAAFELISVLYDHRWSFNIRLDDLLAEWLLIVTRGIQLEEEGKDQWVPVLREESKKTLGNVRDLLERFYGRTYLLGPDAEPIDQALPHLRSLAKLDEAWVGPHQAYEPAQLIAEFKEWAKSKRELWVKFSDIMNYLRSYQTPKDKKDIDAAVLKLSQIAKFMNLPYKTYFPVSTNVIDVIRSKYLQVVENLLGVIAARGERLEQYPPIARIVELGRLTTWGLDDVSERFNTYRLYLQRQRQTAEATSNRMMMS